MFEVTLIVLLSTLLLLIFQIIQYALLSRLNKKERNESEQLGFSIIIAAKNEEQNFENLFSSLSAIDYPEDKFEVIIVDDNSEDSTFKSAEKLSNGHKNYKIIKTRKQAALSGKRAALTTGIDRAKFNYILITDADCIVPPDWLKIYSSEFRNNDIVFGIASLIQTGSFTNKIACFDNLKSQILVFFLSRLGLYYSASARNLAFRKDSFLKIMGYENTTDTLSGDDDLFIREALKNNLKISYTASKDSIVYSFSKSTVKDYLKQKARHTSSSHFYLISRKIVLGFWHIPNLTVFFSFLLSFYSSIFVMPVIMKLMVDYLINQHNQEKFGYNFKAIESIALQFTYELLVVIHFLNSFRFRNRWN